MGIRKNLALAVSLIWVHAQLKVLVQIQEAAALGDLAPQMEADHRLIRVKVATTGILDQAMGQATVCQLLQQHAHRAEDDGYRQVAIVIAYPEHILE